MDDSTDYAPLVDGSTDGSLSSDYNADGSTGTGSVGNPTLASDSVNSTPATTAGGATGSSLLTGLTQFLTAAAPIYATATATKKPTVAAPAITTAAGTTISQTTMLIIAAALAVLFFVMRRGK
jgi:hypothetical protein